jgi:hypothetical protein
MKEDKEPAQELIDMNENKEYKGYLIKVFSQSYLMIVNTEITNKMIESNQELQVELAKSRLPEIKISLNKDTKVENINNVSFIKLPKDKYEDDYFINDDDEDLEQYKENIKLFKQKLLKASSIKKFLIILALVLGLILVILYFLFFRTKKEYDSEEIFNFENINITWPKLRKRGHGIINYLNGYRFDGNFKKGRANGEGIIYDGNGDTIIDGLFKDGLLINGSLFNRYFTYTGGFKNNTFDDYGEYRYNTFNKKIMKEKNFYLQDGIEYKGYWKNGKKHGRGVMIYEYDNHKNMTKYYIGEWENDRKNGKGQLFYGKLDYYDGEWKNNARSGLGQIYKNGTLIFNGTWSDDKKSGKGISYNDNGTKLYEGEWLNDKKNGKGKLFYDDGDYYEGNFANDKRHGYGMVLSKGKIVCSGNFVEDNFQYEKSEQKKKHC